MTGVCIRVKVTLMARTEIPGTCSDTGQTDGVVEHMIIEEGETSECVLVPSTGDDEALATQWVAASEGGYVSLDEFR